MLGGRRLWRWRYEYDHQQRPYQRRRRKLLNDLHLLSDNVILKNIDVGGIANNVLGNVLSGNTVGDVLSGNAIANLTTNLLSGNDILNHVLSDNTTAILGVADRAMVTRMASLASATSLPS